MRESGQTGMSVLLGGQFAGGGGEEIAVGVDVGFSGGGGHEGHVVERREEDAAVEGVEVEEAFEFEIGSSGGFAAVAGRFCGESIFGAGAEADYIPGEAGGAEIFRDTIGEALGERDHAYECDGREDVFEGDAHGG